MELPKVGREYPNGLKLHARIRPVPLVERFRSDAPRTPPMTAFEIVDVIVLGGAPRVVNGLVGDPRGWATSGRVRPGLDNHFDGPRRRLLPITRCDLSLFDHSTGLTRLLQDHRRRPTLDLAPFRLQPDLQRHDAGRPLPRGRGFKRHQRQRSGEPFGPGTGGRAHC